MFQIQDIDNSRCLNPNSLLNAKILGLEYKSVMETCILFLLLFIHCQVLLSEFPSPLLPSIPSLTLPHSLLSLLPSNISLIFGKENQYRTTASCPEILQASKAEKECWHMQWMRLGTYYLNKRGDKVIPIMVGKETRANTWVESRLSPGIFSAFLSGQTGECLSIAVWAYWKL